MTEPIQNKYPTLQPREFVQVAAPDLPTTPAAR